jgi:hypothetical protein
LLNETIAEDPEIKVKGAKYEKIEGYVTVSGVIKSDFEFSVLATLMQVSK